MIGIKTIVVATDFEEAADSALNYGRELARAFGARLVLLNIADNLVAEAAATGGYIIGLEDAQTEVEKAARASVEKKLTDEDRRVLKAEGVVLVSRTPAWAIVDYAQKNTVDLLIMGTHGRGGLGHLFLGSVAERVVRAAPCPVLTVRHPEHEFVLPDTLAVATSTRSR